VGRGSDLFLRSLMMGSTSSRSLRFSSLMRTSSSRKARSSASRSLMMFIMRAMSSWVGAESCVSASAAVVGDCVSLCRLYVKMSTHIEGRNRLLLWGGVA
jgi:hypothetical protein